MASLQGVAPAPAASSASEETHPARPVYAAQATGGSNRDGQGKTVDFMVTKTVKTGDGSMKNGENG